MADEVSRSAGVPETLVSPTEAAKILKIPVQHIQNWRMAGYIKPVAYRPGPGRGGRVPLYRLIDLIPRAQRARRRSPEDSEAKTALAILRAVEGRTLEEIAEEADRSRAWVSAALRGATPEERVQIKAQRAKRQSERRRGRRSRRNEAHPRRFRDAQDRADIIRELMTGTTIANVAREYGVVPGTIRAIVKQHATDQQLAVIQEARLDRRDRKGRRWTPDELLIAADQSLTLKQKRDILHRSHYAVVSMIRKINAGGIRLPDTRPRNVE